MESPLEVLSRAATMVQDKAASESKLPNKELPTTKWRRERRRLSEYQTNSSTNNNNNSNNNNNMPTQVSIKSRSPPPYREPLPGSTFALTLVRPTVITVGPKVVKEECRLTSDSPLVSPGLVDCASIASKRSENTSSSVSPVSPVTDGAVSPNGLAAVVAANRVKAGAAPQQPQNISSVNNNNSSSSSTNSNSNKNDRVSESISMCDTVIDEHFRRSLGNNYMELFDKTGAGGGGSAASSASISPVGAANSGIVSATAAASVSPKGVKTKRIAKSSPPSPPVESVKRPPPEDSSSKDDDGTVDFSVDDHFAKALGETWNKLKATQKKEEKDYDNTETEDESGSEEEVDRNSRKNKRQRTDRKSD